MHTLTVHVKAPFVDSEIPFVPCIHLMCRLNWACQQMNLRRAQDG